MSIKWKRGIIQALDLNLDYENARLLGRGSIHSENEIIELLFEKEDLMSIVDSIAKNGYFVNEAPIVSKLDNDYIVLEGNRRAAAVKVLLNPELAPPNRFQKVKKLAETAPSNTFEALECYVSENRDQAISYIIARHTNPLIKGWPPANQSFYFKSLVDREGSIAVVSDKFNISDTLIYEALHRVWLIEAAKRAVESPLKELLENDPKLLKITTLERLVKTPEVKKYLGIEFSESKVRLSSEPTHFLNAMKEIVGDLIGGKVDSRRFNKKDGRSTYIKSLNSTTPKKRPGRPMEFDLEKFNLDKLKHQEPKKKVPTTDITWNKNKLFPSYLEVATHNERINRLFKQMSSITSYQKDELLAISLRVLLELSVSYHLRQTNQIEQLNKFITTKLKVHINKEFGASLSQMLKFIASTDYKNDSWAKGDREALRGFLQKKKFTESFNVLNHYIHNSSKSIDFEEVKNIVKELIPLLKVTLKEPQ